MMAMHDDAAGLGSVSVLFSKEPNLRKSSPNMLLIQ